MLLLLISLLLLFGGKSREGTETIWCRKLRAQQYNLPQQIKILDDL